MNDHLITARKQGGDTLFRTPEKFYAARMSREEQEACRTATLDCEREAICALLI
jgi:hypothetical protein